MRKLSYFFMAMSFLCLAMPALAQGGEAGERLGRHHGRFLDGDCVCRFAVWRR